VLAHQAAFHLAVLIARDDRNGGRFDACTTVPPYLTFEQRNPVNLDQCAQFSEGQGAQLRVVVRGEYDGLHALTPAQRIRTTKRTSRLYHQLTRTVTVRTRACRGSAGPAGGRPKRCCGVSSPAVHYKTIRRLSEQAPRNLSARLRR
jgi:hypothetical protein